jgi:DNA-binding response OmpR family regulator
MLQGLAVAAPSPIAGEGPDRLAPLSLADDAPWGNVLVHAPDAAEALELQRILRLAGYRIVGPAASRADVERYLERNEIDCALVDARAGFELAALLDAREVPLVVVSGDPAGAVLWRAAGRQLVLRPYRAAEILRAIHAAMRKSKHDEDRPNRIAPRAS